MTTTEEATVHVRDVDVYYRALNGRLVNGALARNILRRTWVFLCMERRAVAHIDPTWQIHQLQVGRCCNNDRTQSIVKTSPRNDADAASGDRDDSQNTSSTFSSEQIWRETQFNHSFSEGPKCDVCKRTKITRAPCGESRESRTPHMETQLQRITKVSMKRTNRDCIIDMRQWHRIWQLNG